MDVDCDGPSSARRRRERRLRSWLRHERMTVAAALAEALHHSAPKVGAVPNNAPWSQKTARASGEHPGVLKEPEVQLEAATVGYVAASTPLLVVASLAGGDDVDATTVSYFLSVALAKKKEEEEKEKEVKEKEAEEVKAREERKAKLEEKMLVINRRVRDGAATPAEEAAWRRWMGIAPGSSSSTSGKRRKRKKRRKKKTPRASSHPSLRRAHRRQRQWYVLARFAGYDTPRAVFPSIVNARGDSTGAVLGQVIALADEARGDSTVAVAGQGVHARCCCCVWCLWSDSAENCGDSTGAVPGQGVHARCCCGVWCHLPDSTENCGGPAVAVLASGVQELWIFLENSSWNHFSIQHSLVR